jgi:hypothetical protein
VTDRDRYAGVSEWLPPNPLIPSSQHLPSGPKGADLLIAAAAEQANLTLLHYVSGFDLIAKVTGQRCQWVVPAGTIH